jgi:hypothetical protein
MIPKMLSAEQKELQEEICSDFLQHKQNEPDWLKSEITCDETQKQNDSHCTGSHQTFQEKKGHTSNSKFKAMLLVFFDIHAVVVAEWVTSSQTVTQHYYVEILIKLHEHVRRKWPGLWRNGWILLQDNVPPHNALFVKQFLASENVTVLANPA